MSIAQKNPLKRLNYLAVDYGKSKVGLALAENETKIAFGFSTLPNDKIFIKKLIKIIEEKEIGEIIIGVSRVNGQMKYFEAGKELGEKIQEVFPKIKIIYQDEMFTTKMAQANLIEKGMKNVQRFDDMEAARIILESWLEKN